MPSRNPTRLIAAGAAAIAIAIGGYAVGNSNSGDSATGVASTAPASQQGDQLTRSGQVPRDWGPGTGTIISGTSADRAKAAAVAEYPDGTVNRVLQLSDGSYAVHRIGTAAPHHIFVSKGLQGHRHGVRRRAETLRHCRRRQILI